MISVGKYAGLISLIMILVVEVEGYSRESLKVHDPYKKVYYPNRHLKAKGGGGGKGKKSGAGSLDIDESIFKPDPEYKYKYGPIKNNVTYYNAYWDYGSNRTAMPLYVYYMK